MRGIFHGLLRPTQITKRYTIRCPLRWAYNGTKSGSSYQGDCPRHGSSGGKCLVIWPGVQGFKCYHCGESGDVIDLVTLYKRCDHKAAVNFLADRVGLPHLGDDNLSPEEKAKRQAETDEENLVYDMLTARCRMVSRATGRFPRNSRPSPEPLRLLARNNRGAADRVRSPC